MKNVSWFFKVGQNPFDIWKNLKKKFSGLKKLFCYSTYDPKTFRRVVRRLSRSLTKIATKSLMQISRNSVYRCEIFWKSRLRWKKWNLKNQKNMKYFLSMTFFSKVMLRVVLKLLPDVKYDYRMLWDKFQRYLWVRFFGILYAISKKVYENASFAKKRQHFKVGKIAWYFFLNIFKTIISQRIDLKSLLAIQLGCSYIWQKFEHAWLCRFVGKLCTNLENIRKNRPHPGQ